MERLLSNQNRPPRVLFFGMQGNFSWPSLHALLESGVEVSAVVLPAQDRFGLDQPAIYRRDQPRQARSLLPVLNSSLYSGIVQLAQERQIPLWEVARMSDAGATSVLTAYQPDIICVACFTLHIPQAILDVPRLGCLNVHPSLLPANRGPLPLFWAFRQGLKQSGVTIHFMDSGMDTGDILAQETIELADGMSYTQLEQKSAMLGGEMLARTVKQLYEGCAVRVQQDESKSSYQSFPSDDDYVVPVAEWSAAHVYNFICGIAEWGGPVKLHVGKEYFVVQEAISYSHDATPGKPGVAYYWRGEELWIRCNTGWVGVIS